MELKKINDLGGVSPIAKNTLSKVKETKVSAIEEYKKARAQDKADIAEVQNEYKRYVSQRKEELKKNLKQLADERSINSRLNKIDPEGTLDRNRLKSELLVGKGKTEKYYKEHYDKVFDSNGMNLDPKAQKTYDKISKHTKSIATKSSVRRVSKLNDKATSQLLDDLTNDEIRSFNSGEKTLHQIQKDRVINGVSTNLTVKKPKAKVNVKIDLSKADRRLQSAKKTVSESISNAKNTASESVTKAKKTASESTLKAKETAKKTSDSTKKAVEAAKGIDPKVFGEGTKLLKEFSNTYQTIAEEQRKNRREKELESNKKKKKKG